MSPVLARNTAGELYLHAGNGTGVLAAPTLLGGGWAGVAGLTAVGDVTGDGVPDLIGTPPELVDEQGAIVDPSVLTAMIAARELAKEPGATVIHNLITSRAVPQIVGNTALAQDDWQEF